MTTNATALEPGQEIADLSELTNVVSDDPLQRTAYVVAWDSYVYEVVQT